MLSILITAIFFILRTANTITYTGTDNTTYNTTYNTVTFVNNSTAYRTCSTANSGTFSSLTPTFLSCRGTSCTA